MKADRRLALKAAVGVLVPLFFSSTSQAAQKKQAALLDGNEFLPSEIHIIQKSSPARLEALYKQRGYSEALAKAVLNFLQNTYPTAKLPVWNKPLAKIDMASRLPRITKQVLISAQKYAAVFPLDPAWIMAQMMTESFYYEFAISSAMAVGPCQFMPATAKSYGLICVDSRTISPTEVRQLNLEKNNATAETLRTQMRALRRKHADLFRRPAKVLRTMLEAQEKGQIVPDTKAYLPALHLMERKQAEYRKARAAYKKFLEENFHGRSIFSASDVKFLEKFDQRVLYHHSIDAMARMMAQNLRARNGNILAATAGYNAGPGNTTYPSAPYKPYGRIPNFSETVDYICRIIITHHEICARMS